MWKCLQCSHDNEDEARFCTNCGTARPTERIPPAVDSQNASPTPHVSPSPEKTSAALNPNPPRKKTPVKVDDSKDKKLTGIIILVVLICAAFILIWNKMNEERASDDPLNDLFASETMSPNWPSQENGGTVYDQLIWEGWNTPLTLIQNTYTSSDVTATIQVPELWTDISRTDGVYCELQIQNYGAELILWDNETCNYLLSFLMDHGNHRQGLLDIGYKHMGTVGDVPVYYRLVDYNVPEEQLQSILQLFSQVIVPNFQWTDESSYYDSDSYMLPYSDTLYVTEYDLDQLTHEELCFARNEIFARHGWIFTTPELRDYFYSKSWYQGTVSANQFDSNVFSEVERTNINFITDYENKWYGGSYY